MMKIRELELRLVNVQEAMLDTIMELEMEVENGEGNKAKLREIRRSDIIDDFLDDVIAAINGKPERLEDMGGILDPKETEEKKPRHVETVQEKYERLIKDQHEMIQSREEGGKYYAGTSGAALRCDDYTELQRLWNLHHKNTMAN